MTELVSDSSKPWSLIEIQNILVDNVSELFWAHVNQDH